MNNIIKDIISFEEFGKKTLCENKDGIPYFTNEFWTSAQRQSHSIHEISYRACFKAQLPEFFISRLSKEGDTILDPFMGRGTTLIQAALMKRNVYGNDINPLSILLTRPRLNKISLVDISNKLKTVDWSRGTINDEDLFAFYHPETLKKLESLKIWISENIYLNNGEIDPIVDWIRMVAINRLSGHSSGFFSGRSMPPNQAVSIKSQIKINEKLGLSPPVRDVENIIIKKSKSLLKDVMVNNSIKYGLSTGNAYDLQNIKNNSVNLTITSPPFLDIVQYSNDNWLRCWFADIDVNSIKIDMHKSEASWKEMIRKVLVEQERVLCYGGHVAIEVGEVRNSKVLLEKLVWEAANNLSFEKICVIVNDQKFTKTSNIWGIDNNKMGTNTNRIVILRKK